MDKKRQAFACRFLVGVMSPHSNHSWEGAIKPYSIRYVGLVCEMPC